MFSILLTQNKKLKLIYMIENSKLVILLHNLFQKFLLYVDIFYV